MSQDGNDSITYEHHKQVSASGALPLVAEASVFFYENRLTNAEAVHYEYSDEVIIARCHNEIVGVMTFSEYDWLSEFFIKISYVRPQFRCRGIHTAMHAKLKEIAKKRGIKYLQSGVHVDNKKMLRHLGNRGRKQYAIIFQDIVD